MVGSGGGEGLGVVRVKGWWESLGFKGVVEV